MKGITDHRWHCAPVALLLTLLAAPRVSAAPGDLPQADPEPSGHEVRVTVPANADASITSIKRIAKTAAEEHSAASGAEPQAAADPATPAPVSDVTSGFTPVSLIDDPAVQGGVTLL